MVVGNILIHCIAPTRYRATTYDCLERFGLTRATWALWLITQVAEHLQITGGYVSQTVVATRQVSSSARIGNRRKVRVPGRLTWRDASGALRFVSVMTTDVSDVDAFVECQVPASIPLYRLVHFQVEQPARNSGELPTVLRSGKVLSAVYRVGPYKSSTGTPRGYALRLLVEPARTKTAVSTPDRIAVAN
jgi:hypothetical protein